MNICVRVLYRLMSPVLLGVYLRAGLLDHTVILHLTFGGTFKLFPKAVALVYLSTSSVWGLQFLHILTNTCYFLVFFFTAMLLSVMVLICIFLMANDVSMFSCVYCLYAFLSAWSTLQPKKKFETTLADEILIWRLMAYRVSSHWFG